MPNGTPQQLLETGRELARSGNVDGACQVLAEAVAGGDPVVAPEAAGLLGTLLADRGDTAGARSAYEYAVASRHPVHAPVAALGLGALLAGLDDTAGAVRAFGFAASAGDAETAALARRTLALYGPPTDPEPAYEEACRLLADGDPAAALSLFQQVVDGGDAEFAPLAACRIGGLLAERGASDEAATALWYAVRSGHREHAPLAAYVLGQILVEQGDLARARDVLALAAEVPDARMAGSSMATLAEVHAGAGEDAAALHWFARLVAAGDADLAPHASYRIGVLLADHDVDGAQAAFRYAADARHPQVSGPAAGNLDIVADRSGVPVRAEPAAPAEVCARAALVQGLLRYTAGDPDGARTAFGEAASCPVPPVAAEAYARLGAVEKALGRPDDALAPLERAYASGHPPAVAMAALDLADLLVHRGQAERAVAMLRSAAAGAGPVAAMAGVNLGVLLARDLGDPAAGLAELRRVAAGGEPGAAAAALFTLGTLVEDAGDADTARRAYEEAVALRQPEFSGRAAINLGVLLSRRQDFEGAQRAWRTAAEVGTDDDRAKARRMLDEVARQGGAAAVTARARQVAADPDLAAAAELAAAEHFRQREDVPAALRAYEKALETGHPRYAAEGAARLALSFWLHSGTEGAAAAIDRLGATGHPELMPRAWFLLGAALVVDEPDAGRYAFAAAGAGHAASRCAVALVDGDTAAAGRAYAEVRETAPDLADRLDDLVAELAPPA
ncbi:tetratricopeptide repeat protein [Actinocatenispora rupis]|uniref:Tetratricopeptide repeat protein n=1 Tax=Actinocatenispora rupis TaxID=519421 RepID=A0A8J3IYF7_9ACTN|nr:tetratricopeptide repeat protein [Actinocatenispora rupis]GID10958.1 hypothetical protein Aru02nite_18470 [Actinocatenispora rupis]